MSAPAFVLPDLLVAERRGRALVEAHRPAPGVSWSVVAQCGPEGATALAAARHAHNAGAAVTVYLTSPEAESHDAYNTMLEVLGAMDLPLRLWTDDTAAHLPAEGTVVVDASSFPPVRTAATCLDTGTVDGSEIWQPRGARPFLHALEETPPPLPTAAVRALDAAAIEDYGLPGLCLMENAGAGATAVALDLLADTPRRTALVLAGSGNNGGDGFVVARGLVEEGATVQVGLTTAPDRMQGDAGTNLQILRDAGVEPIGVEALLADLPRHLAAADLVVDGLLGTGLSGAVRPPCDTLIAALNQAAAPVLSLDIPSGLAGDDGAILGQAVRAATTVTFAAVKTGLLRGAGPARCGRIVLADIGCPRELLAR